MKKIRILLLAILSSLMLFLALPNELYPWGNPALGLISLAPLYLALTMASSYKQAFIATSIFGGLAHGLSSYWLWFFKDFRFWTLGTTIIAYMVIYGFLGLYLYASLKRTGISRPLVFALVWTVFEWGKSTGFLGYPWGLVGYTWNTIIIATQIAESTGVYGLSFALAFFSAAFGEMLATKPALLPTKIESDIEKSPAGQFRFILPPRTAGMTGYVVTAGPLVAATIMLAGIMAYGIVALEKPRMERGSFTAVMVQQNRDPWEGSESQNLAVSIQLARDAIAREGKNPDVILFSETTLRRPWNGFQQFYAQTPKKDPLSGFLKETGSYLFTGAPEILDYKTYEATNSVILVDPHGNQVGTYAKIHPVPFAEAIPFWEYEPFRLFIQDVVGLESGWTMGSDRYIFKLPTREAGDVMFAGPICFEDAFADLCRKFVLDGAEVLINLTNDSWSKTHSAEIQHFVAARFRSIETRRTLVRSTNGGVSAIVGPDGRILEMLPLFESTSIFVRIPVYVDEITPYLLYGDWFVVMLACILGFVIITLYFDDALSRKERP